MKNKNVITNEVTEAVKKAGISDETRELLIIKGMLNDTIESLHQWIIESNYGKDGDNFDKIYNPSSELHGVIDKYLVQFISENMLVKDFKDI